MVLFLFSFKNSQSFNRVMCTLNLEWVKYIVTQRTHFDRCCQFRDWCTKSHDILIDLFNPIMQNKKCFLADSMTLLYELCIYPSTKSKNSTQVAGPSIISALVRNLRLRIFYSCIFRLPHLIIGVGVEGIGSFVPDVMLHYNSKT